MPAPVIAAIATAALLVATPSELAYARAAGSLTLHAELSWQGGDAACPAGTPSSIECHPHPGGPTLVPGLGDVRQQYLYYVVVDSPECKAQGGFNVADYTARLIVERKGEINLAVRGITDCLFGPEGSDTVINNTQSFTIMGGSGAYAGASGNGTVKHVASRPGGGHAAGRDLWQGTLAVPGLEFDLAPPTITGADNKVVRAPRRTKRVRVAYAVNAVDAVDGNVPVSCTPSSGSRFKVGRTPVRCSATDSSANAQTATFTVTVRKRH